MDLVVGGAQFKVEAGRRAHRLDVAQRERHLDHELLPREQPAADLARLTAGLEDAKGGDLAPELTQWPVGAEILRRSGVEQPIARFPPAPRRTDAHRLAQLVNLQRAARDDAPASPPLPQQPLLHEEHPLLAHLLAPVLARRAWSSCLRRDLRSGSVAVRGIRAAAAEEWCERGQEGAGDGHVRWRRGQLLTEAGDLCGCSLQR